MKALRGLLLSTAFLGLAWLAINPDFVVNIQNIFNPNEEIITPEIEKPSIPVTENSSESILDSEAETPESKPQTSRSEPVVTESKIDDVQIIEIENIEPKNIPPKAPEIVRPKPPELPFTIIPDKENLPVIDNFDQVADDDDWIEETPCLTDIFDIPKHLPTLSERRDGPFFSETLKASNIQNITNQPTYIFKTENGVTLKVIRPIIDYYNLSGDTYREVQEDLFERKPLDNLRQIEADIKDLELDIPNQDDPDIDIKYTRTADIVGPITLETTVGGLKDKYEIYPDNTKLTIGFLITLPQWKNYSSATPEDQLKWDDFFCHSAHHELGHLRIRLDIIAQTLNGYAALPPEKSAKDMQSSIREYQKKVLDLIDERQEVYHIYNGGGPRRGMGELPYEDLPFPWLERERNSP